MAIKSIFLPKEGLQGEDIPSHITWDNLDYDKIVLTFSDFLAIKEIYNASDLDTDVNKNRFEIESIDVDGYIGLLFKSSRSKLDKKLNGFVNFSFIKNKSVIYSIKKEVSLYRPLLKISNIPISINVSFPEETIDNKIGLQNIGDATSIIGLTTTEKSEIKEDLPDDQKHFFEELNKSLEDEVNFLKETFPKYDILLDNFLKLETNPKINAKKFNDELEQALLNDNVFSNSFTDSIHRVFISNIKFKSLINNFVAYTESLVGSKILILNPFAVIGLSENPKTILLKVIQSDLLLSDYEPIMIQPIKISANREGTVELRKLFSWGENGSISQ